METLIQDIRYGLRNLAKAPGFTAIALITLALGIGANAAIFSAMNAVLLRAFPLRDPGRLVMVWETNPKIEGFLGERLPVRLKSYLRWKSDSHSFDDMAALAPASYNVSGKDRPEHVEAAQVSSNFFQVLGVKPQIGRAFAPREGDPGNNRVAILSQGTYQRHFGKESELKEKTIRLDDVDYAVIGVLPARFHLPSMWEGMDQKKPEVWTPLNVSASQPDATLLDNKLMVYGRLKRGVSLEKARSEIQVIAARLAQEDSKHYRDFGANTFSIYTEDVGKSLRTSLLVLQFAVVFVLLIACANVANLLLTRAASREREIAVRMAVGAGSRRIVRQVLSESVLLSLLGGLAGLLLAYWGIHVLSTLAPEDIHGLHEMRLDPYVLIFTFVIIVATGVLFGSAPALHALKQDVAEALTKGGRPGTMAGSNRMRNLLVVSEISLALVLLVGGGLMTRSLRALTQVDLGIRADQILSGHIALPESKYKNDAQRMAFCDELLSRLQALPHVKAVAVATGLPMQDVSMTGFRAEGQVQQGEQDQRAVDYQAVTDGYFAAMGSPILRGRSFTRQESDQHANVMIVNSAFANRAWPGKDAIGKFVVLHSGGQHETKMTVVGIVPDTHQLGPDTPARPEVYIPWRAFSQPKVVIRADVDPMQLATPLADAVMAIDPAQPVYQVQPFAKIVHDDLSDQRFITVLLGVFAVLALVLASVGIYGVLAYSVSQRTSEIGIRMALGAQLKDVLRLVLSQGARLVAIGVAAGLVVAFALTRLMASLLFGVKATDPITFVAVAVLLAIIALLASYLPARRATKVDPIVALRYE